MEICAWRGSDKKKYQFEAGNLEALTRMINLGEGLTILPEMAYSSLHARQKKNLRKFAPPQPSRCVRLVLLKNYPRKGVIEFLTDLLLRR
ncbi:MAG: LysR substrate-binding domain-containing protein [Flavobacteriales bacterium]